ncbi:bromodomain, NET domain protein [Artemisia annua]|uniref:Bromodomain, NET domain protein n=1 Tax=Artemisia annua TaxID=35608 RepID=A0A2U1LNG5_ARTAN|nr:bromodomain, NET domain protein [Artemisia annua]
MAMLFTFDRLLIMSHIRAKLTKSNERGNGNERVGNVHGMGNNARVFDIANERVVNVNDMVNDVVNEVNRVNEFSAVDELDGSSWDDVQTPERTKKAKSEGKSSGFPAASKQIHSTASNAVIPPVVHSPVRMPSRTPSPMQVPEPVKPSNTSTMTKTVFPKLPKPRAKDPNKREMNMEEKQKLGLGLQSMPPEKMPQLLQIIRKRNDQLAQEGDEIELDIEALDTETLWELDRFVTNWKKFVSKTKRQALMVNSASAVAAPSVSADIDDVPMSEKMDGVKKSKKDAGEEDVDIGDEMPESSFPHVEIEKDDGGGGQGQAVTGGGQGNNDNNASSSSSGSSSCGGWLIQTEGFWYHHAEPSYLMLLYWIPETKNPIPGNASHIARVGAIVLNDKREHLILMEYKIIYLGYVSCDHHMFNEGYVYFSKMLVVQEKMGHLRGVWKISTGITHEV